MNTGLENRIRQAVEELRAGRPIIIPTDTVYGLAADPLNPRAVEALFQLKGRPDSNPIPLLVDSIETAQRCASVWPRAAELLADAFWPGPLTIVVQSSAAVDPRVRAGRPTVGLRQPAHDEVLALLRAFAGPLACTSVNISGQPPVTAEKDISDVFLRTHLFKSPATPPGSVSSTVLDVSDNRNAHLLRPGPITQKNVDEVLTRGGG